MRNLQPRLALPLFRNELLVTNNNKLLRQPRKNYGKCHANATNEDGELLPLTDVSLAKHCYKGSASFVSETAAFVVLVLC
jgi:hypothetical protein